MKEALEWLEYCNQEYTGYIEQNVMQSGIKHAFNSDGEKKIGNYYLDGYAEWEGEDGLVTVGFEYNGCRYHRCPFECGIKSVQTDEQYEQQRKKKAYLNRVLTKLEIIQGCQWTALKKILVKRGEAIHSKVTPFLGKKTVSESDIISAVADGSFYGFCRVDVTTPNSVAKKFEKLNFPFIFNNVEVLEEHLEPENLADAKERGCKFPQTVKSLSWNSKGFIGCTPLLRFYLKLGMEISNLQWALQYQAAEPFQEFVNSMVEVRINASRTKNGPLGDRAKFVLNSAVGKSNLTLKNGKLLKRQLVIKF